MIKFSELMIKAPSDQIIGYLDAEPVNFGHFRQDVAYNMQTIKQDKVIVFEESNYRFLVGVMAALQKGANVLFPPNGLPATLAKMSGQRLNVEVGQTAKAEFRTLDPEECLMDFYTSGSTGESKCIRKKLRQIENEVHVLNETWGGIARGTLVLSTVSHQHIYGMLFKSFWPLCAGHMFQDQTFEYWENLFEHITPNSMIISSPAHLSRFPPVDCPSSPKMVFSSGGPLSLEAASKGNEILGQTPMEIFGSTETGGVAYRQQTRPAVPWQPFDILDLRTDAQGVLSIRSPYLEDDGWYEMSDKITFDENGYFHLQGRVDRIVKVEGKRVSLPEVEAVLQHSPWVAEACCLITNDERKSLSAVLVLSPKGVEKHQEVGDFRMGRLLRQAIADHLEQAARPRRWRFVEKIPVNSQGKRLMADLLALY